MPKRLPLFLLLAAAGIAALTVLALAPAGGQPPSSPWPMYGHDSAHTGRSAANGPNTPDLAWSYSLGVRAQDNPSPVVGPDGTIYMPSELGFFAINPNGTLKWRRWGADGFDWTTTRMAPAVAADGTVYMTKWPGDALYALNPADGATLWSYPIGDTTYGSPTVGPDGTIYIGGTIRGSAPAYIGTSHMYALNP